MPRNRTGSRYSLVPPAETTTRRPRRSGSAGAPGEHPRAHVEDLARLGQPARAGVRAGEPAVGRVEHDHATLAQGRDVRPGGRVQPHLGVHRRGEHDRAARGEQGVREQVVGQAVRGLGEQVGRGRRDHDQVGGLADRDVRHLVDVVPDLGGHRMAGQRRPGVGADELAARPRSGRPGRRGRARRTGGPGRRPCRRRCRRRRRRRPACASRVGAWS